MVRVIPVGGEIFLTHPDQPWHPPSLLYSGYRVFPWSTAAGAWCWSPTPSSAEVKESIKVYLYLPSGPSWSVVGWNSLLPFTLVFLLDIFLLFFKFQDLLSDYVVKTWLVICLLIVRIVLLASYKSKILRWQISIKCSWADIDAAVCVKTFCGIKCGN